MNAINELRLGIHDVAAKGVRQWLVARGLGLELSALGPSLPEATALLAASDEFVFAIGRDVNDLAYASDQAEMVAQDAERKARERSRSRHEVGDLLREAQKLLADYHRDASQVLRRAERRTRDLAQLGLGLSACCESTANVEMIDRAGTAILAPPKPERRVALHEDGLALVSSDEPDLAIEVAGVLCRLLLERSTLVRIEIPRSTELIWLQIDRGTTLLLTAQVERAKGSMEAVGWCREECGTFTRAWRSPVSVIHPARSIASLLFSSGRLTSPTELQIVVAPKVSLAA